MTTRRVLLPLILCTLSATSSFAGGSETNHCRYAARMPAAGARPLLDKTVIDKLTKSLRDERWLDAMDDYFGDQCDSRLARWIVFFDDDGSVKQHLIRSSRKIFPFGDGVPADSADDLIGDSHVWVMVFSNKPLAPEKKCGPKEHPLSGECVENADAFASTVSVRLEELANYPGPGAAVIDTVARALSSKETGAIAGGPPALGKDSIVEVNQDITLRRLDDAKPGTPALYGGATRIALNANTRNRLTLYPSAASPRRFPDSSYRDVHAYFNNGQHSAFGMSLGVGGTLFARNNTTSSVETFEPGFALLAHWYPWMDEWWRHGSPSLVVGTTVVKSSLLNQFVLGVGFGRLVGNVGIVVGYDFRELDRTHGTSLKKVWEPRPYLGFNYPL